MIANPQFRAKDKAFWALVRSLSQHLGYTVRRMNRIAIHSAESLARGLTDLNLDPALIYDDGKPTALGDEIVAYIAYRADILNNEVQHLLMDKDEAKALFEENYARLQPTCKIPMNKQKDEKKEPSYFTGLINMLTEEALNGLSCDYDPKELSTFTRNGKPVRTLARRFDGAFPSPVNPIALWEVKEYYFTTTFGSRVADGVYETLLDGLELEEMRDHEGIHCAHYLYVDARATWWDKGRPYLCRIIDMLHMGYVDEAIFGKEIIAKIPVLAEEWVAERARRAASPATVI